MKQKRHSVEEIIRILREVDNGKNVESVCREPPELLRLYGDYKATGPTYRFEYEDEPAGWAGGKDI